MRILIDITHPAFAHFFRATLPALRERGHEVLITSRDKDVTLPLLDAFGIEHECLSSAGRTKWQLLLEMMVRVWRLRRVIKRFRPHAILARDGAFACQAGWLTGVPAITFDDCDDAPIQHALTYPFAWRVYTDRAYRKSIGPKQRFFKGASPLAYLQPQVFQPDPVVLERAGIDAQERRLVLCRLVSWTANHDHQHHGFDLEHLDRILTRVEAFGRVVISSEIALPTDLERYRVTLPPHELHHLMAFCSIYVGESATMAAECAVLGVPSIHVSTRRLWYTEELQRYQLVHNVDNADDCLAVALRILEDTSYHQGHLQRRDRYLQDTDDLGSVVVQALDEIK